MGSWGYGIMEGDTPLDEIYMFEKTLGKVVDVELDKNDFTEYNVNKLINYIETKSYDKNIAYMVLALKIMEFGQIIPEQVKEKVENYTEEYDEWEDPSKRKVIILKFKSIVKEYKEKPTLIQSHGLFQTIYEGECL
jgi:hypothetical protein